MRSTTYLNALAESIDQIATHTRALRVTLVEFHPPGEASLIDDFWNRLDDAIGKLEQARAMLDPAVGTLANCHRELLEVGAILRDEWITSDRLREIRRLASARRGAWVPWARLVENELRELPLLLRVVEERLIDCWESEMAVQLPRVVMKAVGQEFASANIHINTTDGEQP